MYVEKRKEKNKVKHYLVHSYREKGRVKKIRKYLGLNPSLEDLKKAKEHINEILEELNTKVFKFYLTKNQLKKLNEYKIKIYHLDKVDWKRFTKEFVYDTNAIEGSNVQLDEIEGILENKKVPVDGDEKETKNVAKAVDYIRKTKEELSIELIKKLHNICFLGTKSFAGKLREVEVVIRNSKGEVVHAGVPVKELNDYLKEFIEWYKENKNKFKPLILAAIIHNQFEHIHPFQDGNGRVGRLLLNFILLKDNYPPININIEDRREYYLTLEEYSRNQNLKPTIKFLINQYNKTLKQVTTK
jgi:Fic family protein